MPDRYERKSATGPTGFAAAPSFPIGHTAWQHETSDRQPQGVDLPGLLAALRRRLSLIVLCVALTMIAALGLALLSSERYTASASLLFRDSALDREFFGSGQEPQTDQSRQGATNIDLVSLETVSARAARRLGGAVSPDQVTNQTEIKSKDESDLVTVEATAPSAYQAARVANAFAGEYVSFRREADQRAVRRGQQLIRRQLRNVGALGDRRRQLEARAEDLEVLAALQTGDVQLVQRASAPSSPSAPKPAQNTLIGGFAGLLLGLALALGVEQLDRRLKRPEELEALFDLPLLGTVPRSDALRRGQASEALPAAEAESFRLLSMSLRYIDATRDLRTVVVTSAAPGDGKTTVALNLALAAAESRGRVLLLEADLRRPTLVQRLPLVGAGENGLSTLLAGHARSFGEVRHHLTQDSGKGIDVVLAGPAPPNPTDLMASERMMDALRVAEAAYDLVIIDVPPVTMVADAIPLLRAVSGVVVVSRIGASTRDDIERLRAQLARVAAPTLGVVANFVSRSESASYYYEGEAYGASRPGVSADDSKALAVPRSQGRGRPQRRGGGVPPT